MKKLKISALVLAFIIVFAGCSSASNEMAYDGYKSGFIDAVEVPMAPEPEWGYETETEAIADEYYSSSSTNSSAASGDITGEAAIDDVPDSARKLIRTFDLEIETLEFEEFIASVKKEVNALGGYIENSSVSGNSYNYSSSRDANFTCRIPTAKLNDFVDAMGNLGNVTYCYEDAKDVTLTYVDMEARVASLQTEYDRLLELLAEAENIDSIILLEQRLSDVRYQLESYKSQLRTYDNLVDYSTVNLNVREVKRVTSPEQETVWERISSDFSDNVYDLWVGIQDFFVWFVASIPIFALLAVIALVIFFVIKALLNLSPKYREKQKAKKLAKAYKKAQEEKAKEENKGEENKE